MNTEHPPAKNTFARTNRRYAAVSEMHKSEGVPVEVTAQYQKLCAETRMTRALARMRVHHGLTQQELGDKMGVSQSAISKLEAGRDEDLTLSDLRNYADHLDERVGVVFGKPLNAVEAIKLHAVAMRENMLKLAALASADKQMDKAVQAFFGEAFFNILDILSTCQSRMPNGIEGCELRMEVIDNGRGEQVSSERALAVKSSQSSAPVAV